jgi:hypothetical protein
MLCGGKPRNIDPNVRDQILGRSLADTWDRVQERDDLGEWVTSRLNLGFALGKPFFKEFKMGQEVGE